MQTVDHTINIIEISHISFAYQKPEYAVRNISFNVHKGDYLGIIGPNGGGKTTVLKIMLGLLKPMEGHVKLFGQEINNFKDWYKIGYVPQKATSIDANFPVTVEEVVSMGDLLKVKIVEIKEGRVNLSLKALQSDPWDGAKDSFKDGQEVKGVVYKLNPFGAFIRLEHDLMGLIHVSEFGSVEELKKQLEPGSTYSFVVDSVRPEEKRIVLKAKKAGGEAPKKESANGEKSL